MSFDIREAVQRIEDAWNSDMPDTNLHIQIEQELQAAVLAGRQDALAAVSQQHANGWTGERGDGWMMCVAQCERKIRELPDP